MSRRAPQRAAVSAADVAAHVVWLTRPEARNATAQIFTVDAGFSLSYF
jgi:enoyl-[acyl-carrier-protein] reductase (NADH)